MPATLKRKVKQGLHATARAIRNALPGSTKHPIFITGVQKSGTSAIASLLAHATKSSVTIDVFYRMGLLEIDMLNGRTDFDNFLRKTKCYFRSDIVKEPEFILFVEELAEAYPDSKRVFIIREPFDNLRSILNRLNLAGNQNQISKVDLDSLQATYPLWIPLLVPPESDNMGYDYIDTLAERWAFSVATYMKHADDFILLKYEDFMAGKTAAIEQLAERLDLKVVQGLDKVENKQFQPAGKRECPLKFFGEANCEVILKKCSGLANQLGYSIPESARHLSD